MTSDKPATMVDEQLRDACASLDRRLRAGESVRTEDLLAAHADLAAHSECVLELAYTEFVARDALGESCDFAEWYARFPDRADDLRELFEVHRFVQQAAEETVIPYGDLTEDDDALPPQPLLFQEEVDAERRLGNYELIEEIGRGGMGVVYKARQIGVRRVVALKLILAGAHAGRERYERFEAEAETVGRLAHPNIVQIHEVGTEQGRPFLSLEYIEGGSLDRRLSGAPMPPREAAALVHTLAAAMCHAHERGVIHRDLKPANILLTTDGVPKITDFGLAKRIFEEQSGQTASGAMLGTPSYMAPEQALGNSRDSGVAVDVYALGAMLYELLTGRPPFRGATLLDTLEQVRSQEPVAPRQLIGKLPRDLETICLKCLQKQPAHRYGTSAELADDLQRFLDHLPIHARPVGYVGRLARWSARNPMLAVLTAALAVVLTTASIVAPIVAITQTALRQEVQKQLSEVVRQSRAKSASLLATRSRLAADETPQRSVLLAIEAIEAHRAAGEAPPATIEQALRDALASTSGVALVGHQSQLTAARFTPDNSRLVTASADGAARVWTVNANDPGRACVVLAGHQAPIRGLAMSHDGRWLVTAADDRTARLWDLNAKEIEASGREVAQHRERLSAATFSPDDRWLFTADQSGNGKLSRLEDDGTASVLSEIQLELPIQVGQFSGDGKWLAVGGVDKAVHVWPLNEAGLGPHRVFKGHTGHVASLAFDPSRPRLATASADYTVRLWNLDDEAPGAAAAVLTGHTNYVSSVAFTADGNWLFSASYDGTARRWDMTADDPQASCNVLTGHAARIHALTLSHDGRLLATCSLDKSVRLWDISATDPNATARALRGHDDGVQAVAISDDGQWLASASADGTARLWDLGNRIPLSAASHTYQIDAKKVHQVVVSRSGRWLASCSTNDGIVRVVDRNTRREHARLTHDSLVQFLAFSPDERWIVTTQLAKAPRPARLWNLAASDPASTSIALAGPTQKIECLLVDPDGKWIATGSLYDDGVHLPDGKVRLWPASAADGATGRVIAECGADVTCLAYSPAQARIAIGSADGIVRFYAIEPSDAAETWPMLPGHKPWPTVVTALSDKRSIATLDFGGVVRLWDMASETNPPTHVVLNQSRNSAQALTLSEDGRWLAAVDALDRVLLWDMNSFDPATSNSPTMLAGDEKSGGGNGAGCAISPDGRFLATYGRPDAAIRIWNLQRLGDEATPLVLNGHSREVRSAVFTPDSRTLISGGDDGAIREWPLDLDDLLAHARRTAGRSLTDEERRKYVEQ